MVWPTRASSSAKYRAGSRSSGTLVLLGDRRGKVKLAGKYKEVRRIVDVLRAWASNPAGDAPPVVLNKHCPSCPFRDACLQQAEKEDNLSLLDRMTPKLMRKYHDKGIFTVRQLSHIYQAEAEQEEGQEAGAAQPGVASPGHQDGEGPRRAPTRVAAKSGRVVPGL